MLEETTGQIQKIEGGGECGQTIGDLTASIQSFFLKSQFSDMTIRTTAKEFKVHKLVLCAHSEYFSQIYSGRWAEITGDPILLEDDDPDAIEARIDFIYGFDYDSCGSDDTRSSPLLFNVKVYQIADKYCVPQLKQRAKDKFEQTARTCWQMDDFPVAIAEVYERSYEHDRGLRELVVRISQDHNVQLIKSEKFCSVLSRTVGFAADLTLSLSERMPMAKGREFSCSLCSKSWTCKSGESVHYCPFCGNCKKSPWRN